MYLSSDLISFGATLACGAIATVAPMVLGLASLSDRAISSIPGGDRLLLQGIPPRRAETEELRFKDVLHSAYRHNALHRKGSRESTTTGGAILGPRLALSALWMGISAKLLCRQYLYGAGTAIVINKTSNDKKPSVTTSALSSRDPTMMEVFGQLVGSLESNEFVKKSLEEYEHSSSDDNRGAKAPKILGFQNALSMRSGLSIEYDAKNAKQHPIVGKGVILVGDIEGSIHTTKTPGGYVTLATILFRFIMIYFMLNAVYASILQGLPQLFNFR